MIRCNPINYRIVREIQDARKEIDEAKQEIKSSKNYEELKGSFNKLVGNITAMILRKYIENIINYHGLDLKVSYCNAFIKDCPVEWDLIVLKSNAENINNSNIFYIDDVVAVFEFKTSGLLKKPYEEIEDTFGKPFNYIKYFKERNNKKIVFGYVSISESIERSVGTKEYFDKMNEKDDTAFVFVDYDRFVKDDISIIEGCEDFEKYLYGILK